LSSVFVFFLKSRSNTLQLEAAFAIAPNPIAVVLPCCFNLTHPHHSTLATLTDHLLSYPASYSFTLSVEELNEDTQSAKGKQARVRGKQDDMVCQLNYCFHRALYTENG
jgi:hypothetical protein